MNKITLSSIKVFIMSFALLAPSLLPTAVGAREIATHTFASIDGGTIDTEQWQGKPYLVINTASLCGFTKQYAGLQKLYDEYRIQGFGMIAVPSDDFKQELDSDAEVKSFCELNYGINMPMSKTMSVRGSEAHPFFKDVKAISGFVPKWNFNKILIGGDGKVVGTWGSTTKPMAVKLTKAIENELSKSQ
jgi:glutathione peroxidase|tara:strand:- start:95 stop:661 length:567 start_codon:yes stop_codon:yes gene_type:complete